MQRTGFNNARVRQANKSIFLSHLWREKQLSKSQLSQLTGLHSGGEQYSGRAA